MKRHTSPDGTKKGWVLVTDGGTGPTRDRDSVAAVRALAEGGYHVALTVSGANSLASRSRFCERRVQVPPATDARYVDAVRAELEGGTYVTALPTSETALLALSGDRSDLTNKVELSATAQAAGLECPPMQVFPSFEALSGEAERLDFPVVIKPTVRTFYAFVARSPSDLQRDEREDGPLVVQPYIPDANTAVSGVIWNGELVAAVHERWLRIYPHPCGLPSASITTQPDEGLELRLTRLLENYDGIFSAQFIGSYLIDINLRLHTSHPMAVAGGANLASIYCDLVRGETVRPVRARSGVRFRWLEGDIRTLARVWRHGGMGSREAALSLAPRKGTSHNPEALNDPRPMIGRLTYAATRARSNGSR
jgi:predicted ATP-grasp superfamily ATP-dependent carboligase